MRLRSVLAGGLAAVLSWPLGAQTEAPVQAVRLAPGEQIRLDGSLSHPAWQRAPVFERFVEHSPRNGEPPPQATRVQVLFDDHALYVGVTALDSDPAAIRDLPVRWDNVNRTQDFVVAYVDPIGTKRSAQFFRVNAAGSMADGIHTAADDSEDFAPDFDWDAAVQRRPDGWTAVLRLPFASLRFAEGVDGAWRFMLARRLPRQQFHLMASVPIPRDVPSFIHNLQPLTGVTLPREHAFLTVRPSVTLRRTAERGDGVARRGESRVEASLDLKWRPRAELVVDATIRPDFSQVALDEPQLVGNTRFALFFPEKRPFFVESADLLRTPTDAMYTRSFTEPRWGLRGTWRSPAWAGVAFAVDDRGGGLLWLPGPYETGLAEQPGSRTLALRVRDDGGRWQWGAMAALRRYEHDRGANDVLGPDIAWQIDERWRLRAQALVSRTSAQPQAGTLARGAVREGQRLYARLQRQAEDSETSLVVDDVGEGFRHDTGFVNQAGVRSFELFQNKGWRPLGPFNEFFLTLQVQQVQDRASGATIKEVVRPGLWSTAARNLEWFLEWYAHSSLRVAPGRRPLEEHYLASGLVMSPAPWWPLVDTNLAIGRLADTAADRVRPGLNWRLSSKLRPLRRLELEPSLRWAVLDEERGGARMYRESAMQLLAVWHFDARHHLRWIAQRSHLDRRAEPAVPAARSDGRTTSLTYTWRHSAGSVLYLGATRAVTQAPAVRRTSEAFVKLQVDLDDARSWW